mgnify:CR=1 FL=1
MHGSAEHCDAAAQVHRASIFVPGCRELEYAAAGRASVGELLQDGADGQDAATAEGENFMKLQTLMLYWPLNSLRRYEIQFNLDCYDII